MGSDKARTKIDGNIQDDFSQMLVMALVVMPEVMQIYYMALKETQEERFRRIIHSISIICTKLRFLNVNALKKINQSWNIII